MPLPRVGNGLGGNKIDWTDGTMRAVKTEAYGSRLDAGAVYQDVGRASVMESSTCVSAYTVTLLYSILFRTL